MQKWPLLRIVQATFHSIYLLYKEFKLFYKCTHCQHVTITASTFFGILKIYHYIQHVFNHTTQTAVQRVRVYQILSSCFCSLYSVVVFLVRFHINLSSCFLPHVTPVWFGSNHTCLSSVVIWAVYKNFLVSFQIVIVCSSQQWWFHQAHVGSCSVILIWVAFFFFLSAFCSFLGDTVLFFLNQF